MSLRTLSATNSDVYVLSRAWLRITDMKQRKWPEEKLSVGLEPISGFNLRAQVVGRGGDNVKYIQQETSCKVQIKGRGSGFMEPQSGQESDEPMYLHIA